MFRLLYAIFVFYSTRLSMFGAYMGSILVLGGRTCFSFLSSLTESQLFFVLEQSLSLVRSASGLVWLAGTGCLG